MTKRTCAPLLAAFLGVLLAGLTAPVVAAPITATTLPPTAASTTVTLSAIASGSTTTTLAALTSTTLASPAQSEIYLDEASIVSVCEDVANDRLVLPDVTVAARTGRILVVTVGAEETDQDCDLTGPGAAVRWAGVALDRAVSTVSPSDSFRACNGIFYLIDPPAGTADVEIDFPQTTTSRVNNRHGGAFVLYNAAPVSPLSVATDARDDTLQPTLTSIDAGVPGAWIVDIVTNGNPSVFVPWHGRQIERWQQSCGGSSSAASTMAVPTPKTVLVGWLNTDPRRSAHSLAVFAPMGAVSTTTLSTTTSTTTTSTLETLCETDTECGDADACNGLETCIAGRCVTGPVPQCDDGLFCNGAEICDSALGCVDGTAPSCVDGLDCTLDACDENIDACFFAADAVRCDDDDPCTDDACSAELGCVHDDNSASCDDGNYCNGVDACQAGTCSVHAGDPCAAFGDTIGCEATCDEAADQCLGPGGLACNEIDTDNDGLADVVDPCLDDARNLCFGAVAVDLFTGRPIRINAGTTGPACAGERIDCRGQRWHADFAYNQSGQSGACGLGGGGSNCVINGLDELFGCSDEATTDLFRCEHWDEVGGSELAYGFLLPNGDYLVNLFFANTFSGTAAPGQRMFDIVVQGDTAFDDFDQIAAAGASATAVVRSTMAVVENGILLIELVHELENPALKAIEVLSARQAATTTTTTSTTLPGCQSDADCDDGNACNGEESCRPQGCAPGIPLVCDDALYCNGEERCDPVVGCVAGPPPLCDDDVACTADACDEATDTCTRIAACATGEICHPPAAACLVPVGDADRDGIDDGVDPCPADARNLCFGPIAVDSTTGRPIRLNAGVLAAGCAGAKTDCNGDTWEADFGFNQTGSGGACGSGAGAACEIAEVEALFGCTDDATQDLFRCEHWDGPGGAELAYSFEVPAGDYVVNLFFANTFGGTGAAGDRLFDILIENVNVHPRFDQVAVAGASATAVVRSAQTTVTDGRLDIVFRHAVENPTLKAIEVVTNVAPTTTTTLPACTEDCTDGLHASPALIAWGHVALGAEETREISLTNSGLSDVVVRTVAFRTMSGSAEDFRIEIAGQRISGAGSPQPHTLDLVVAAGVEVLLPVTFDPGAARTSSVDLLFETDFAVHDVDLLATGGEGPDDPFLHVVIDAPRVVIDHDGDGSATVVLGGGESHTHEPGRHLAAHVWRVDGAIVATSVAVPIDLPIGEHEISLSIFDNAEPAKILTDTVTVEVVTADAVPGVLALYHDAGAGGDPLALIDAVPATADHGEVLATTTVDAADGTIGSSPFAADRGVLLRMLGAFAVPADGIYEIVASGGEHRLFVNGARVIGPMALAARVHTLDARFALDEAADLPASILFGPLGGPLAPIEAAALTHDETTLGPVINSMTSGGAKTGGQPVLITGIGFFPAASVSLAWGDETLVPPAISVTPTTISLVSPPGVDTTDVAVSTPAGTSNLASYQYDDIGPPPILFATEQLDSLADPTQAAWGPDGRLYVASTQGTITAYTFGDDYEIVDKSVIDVLVGTETSDILGLAFDPLAAPGQVAVYVSHTRIFAKGGACNFSGSFDYIGRVSRIAGPDFDTVEPVVTGLPTSNHDHAVNGLAFDSDGNLLVAVGGNTNAGIEACAFGAVPESPLSGAILEVELARPGFDGAIVHLDRDTGLPLPDQLDGDRAELAHGTDVRVRAPGFRNSFDLVFTTAGRIYNTDNGPDFNLGPASTGPQSQGPDPADVDSLGLVIDDGYHGHPNRNRGRLDPRQNVYRGTADTTAAGELETPVATFQSSVDGIDEYRAATFAGAMRGQLLVQKWNGATYRVETTANGRTAAAITALPVNLQGLDVVAGPGGALVGIDFTDDRLMLGRPVDAGATGLTVYDVFPWRAPHGGGTPFVIGGSGFGDLATTSVTIDGASAVLTAVSRTRIRGTVPPRASASTTPVDVIVSVGDESDLLPASFTYLADPSVDTGASAELGVDGRGSLRSSSTFAGSSFVLRNTSTATRSIVRVRVDLRDALLRDLAFDPAGAAGDPLGKDLTIDSSSGPALVSRTWQGRRHGGYHTLEMELAGFAPGHTIEFSADIDPTSIQGAPAPGPSESGSIGGSELVGATLTVWFDDGTVRHGDLFTDPSLDTAARAVAGFSEAVRPRLALVGFSTPAAVSDAAQVLHVTGPAGATVDVLVHEAALETSTVPGGGNDLQPWEANTVLSIERHQMVLDAAGSADLAVTLQRSDPAGGLNLIVAAIEDAEGHTGRVSAPLIVELLP